MASSAHFYLNWAKERIDEMDAGLTSLEAKTTQITAESRAAAEKIIADLRTKRDAFLNDMKGQAEASEVAWLQAKARLESDWDTFQAEIKKYVEGIGKQINQQQTTFESVATAQLKAWREAADKIQAASAEFAADRRAKVEATVAQMKADASMAEANLEKVTKVGTESWRALNTALEESRAAFDRANQTAWDAFQHARSAA